MTQSFLGPASMTQSFLESVERDGGVCEFVAFRPGQSLEQSLDVCRRAIVAAALNRSRGHMGRAAMALALHRNSLTRICDRLDINHRDFGPNRRKRVVRADVRDVMRGIGAGA